MRVLGVYIDFVNNETRSLCLVFPLIPSKVALHEYRHVNFLLRSYRLLSSKYCRRNWMWPAEIAFLFYHWSTGENSERTCIQTNLKFSLSHCLKNQIYTPKHTENTWNETILSKFRLSISKEIKTSSLSATAMMVKKICLVLEEVTITRRNRERRK